MRVIAKFKGGHNEIGLSFTTIELQDPGEMKEFAQGAEQLGFHILPRWSTPSAYERV